MAADLIDTTEMYLKTIFELEEDGIVPLRARIVERLGHSGPTVSQTIARMERDGLVTVREDRHLDLTPNGRRVARDVMRKHRLAERLLVDIIGMDWIDAHDEACRWEHVMSAKVEEQLPRLLGDPETDPYGNPVPGLGRVNRAEESVEVVLQRLPAPPSGLTVTISRIGEPLQAEDGILSRMAELEILPGKRVRLVGGEDLVRVLTDSDSGSDDQLVLERGLASHLFIIADEQPL